MRRNYMAVQRNDGDFRGVAVRFDGAGSFRGVILSAAIAGRGTARKWRPLRNREGRLLFMQYAGPRPLLCHGLRIVRSLSELTLVSGRHPLGITGDSNCTVLIGAAF